MGTAGKGYVNANDSPCASDYTYIDLEYPATETFLVDRIEVSNSDAGTNFKIGYGSISGTTFTPEHYVTLASVGVGVEVFNAPADFTAFEIPAGRNIFLYSHSDNAEPTRTYTPVPKGYGACVGYKMDDVSFGFVEYTTRVIEVEFSGSAAGWAGAEVDGQDPSDIEDIDSQGLSDIDTIDGQ